MKKFINKISKGSKVALFLEILLLAQVIFYVYTYVGIPECNHDEHQYPGHITDYSGGDNYGK